MAVKASDHWTRFRHKDWKECQAKWNYTWTHYIVDIDALKTKDYLFQRKQGEHPENFDERIQTSDYLPLFSVSVDALVGRIFEKEPIPRVWQIEGQSRGLGSIKDTTSTSHRLWKDSNGKGASYTSQIFDAGVKLVALRDVWVYVRGIPRDANGRPIGEASIHIIDPSAVVNWFEDDEGNVVAALLETSRDMRSSIEDEPQEQKEYLAFFLEGTKSFLVDPETQDITENKLVPYGGANNPKFRFYKTADQEQEVLPIRRFQLPMRRLVGYNLAHKNNVIFNQESERDNLLRIACTPQFVFVGDDEQFEKAAIDRQDGANATQLDPNAQHEHYYTHPSTEPARVRTEVIRDKVADFFLSTFRFYEDSVRGKQKTATEISQDARGGEGSFLNTLAGVLDAVENGIGFLLYQIYFPGQPGLWDQFHVERPRDFQPISAVQAAEKLRDLIFPSGGVPIGDSGRVNAAKRIAEAFDLEYMESEIQTEIAEAEEAGDGQGGINDGGDNDEDGGDEGEGLDDDQAL